MIQAQYSTIASENSKQQVSNLLQIQFDSVTKRFGHVLANDAITCNIVAGGIHAFLGENGAGKSTLMKILAGYYQPDSGQLYIDNSQINFKSPAHARHLGIGMVHQQFTLVPSLTVLENILLGHPSTPIVLNHQKQANAIRQKAAQYGIELDLFSPVSRLNMAKRQQVEILKLLWRDARILILDEPTSQLSPIEAEEILRTMDNLASSGRIVILVTHHIEELLKFASTITVLRQGHVAANFQARSVRAEELAEIMLGPDMSILAPSSSSTSVSCLNTTALLNTIGREVISSQLTRLALENVSLKASPNHRALNNINLHVRAGEVHGIASVTGSGENELALILAGQIIPDGGYLFLDGIRSSWQQLKNPKTCLAHVPADPKQGSIDDLTLLENLFLRDIHNQEFLTGPFIKRKRVAAMAHERIAAFDVRPKHITALGRSLSGGNLQRLILAREFDQGASLVVAVNPTAGLDLAMSFRVRNELRQYASNGRSVLLISPDLDELLKTCDRISIMFGGRIVGTEYVNDLNTESLGLMLGGKSSSELNSNKLKNRHDFTPVSHAF